VKGPGWARRLLHRSRERSFDVFEEAVDLISVESRTAPVSEVDGSINQRGHPQPARRGGGLVQPPIVATSGDDYVMSLATDACTR